MSISTINNHCAIYFQPEAYSISGQKLMGRNAAGESFIRGYLRYSKSDTLWAQVLKPEHAQVFANTAQSLGVKKKVNYLTPEKLSVLEQVGCIYYPGPDIKDQSFLRSQLGASQWSICGITHTTSSSRAMDAIASLLTAPIEPWDAIICTSKAVKKHVELILQAEANRLKLRLGIQQVTLPQLPIIPLGIHTDEFIFTDIQKSKARKVIQVDDDSIVVLYMGRLSFHAKAHPLAMYQALEIAAKNTDKKITLIECGWFANEYTQKAFKQAQELACPNVDVIYLDGRDAENRKTAWSSADVFCSLSDNIQETFGITPIEAMAAGLPVVVSDWDGYKDTVTDGEVGFRIPTTLPQAGLGGDLAFHHAAEIDNYDFYCGHTSSFIAVDVQSCSKAFTQLFNDPKLRQTMGQAGKKRATAIYDWSVIIPQYETLWSQLDVIRKKSERKPAQIWPARQDPFTSFAHYSTQSMTPHSQIRRMDKDLENAKQTLKRLYSLEMVGYAHKALPSVEVLQILLEQIDDSPTLVQSVIKAHTGKSSAENLRALNVLHKLGLIQMNIA